MLKDFFCSMIYRYNLVDESGSKVPLLLIDPYLDIFIIKYIFDEIRIGHLKPRKHRHRAEEWKLRQRLKERYLILVMINIPHTVELEYLQIVQVLDSGHQLDKLAFELLLVLSVIVTILDVFDAEFLGAVVEGHELTVDLFEGMIADLTEFHHGGLLVVLAEVGEVEDHGVDQVG